jgi:hypothetical protein
MSEITTVKGKLTSIYTFKGSVSEYYDLLDKSDANEVSIGDVYNVETEYNGYPAGTNWAWTGLREGDSEYEGWDALGGSIDFSTYYTKEEVGTEILNAINSYKAEA